MTKKILLMELLTSVKVVCREVPGFSAQQQIERCIEAFLDYTPQFSLSQACHRLPLRLVKRVFASQEWKRKEVASAVWWAIYEERLHVVEWLCRAVEEVTNMTIPELLREARALEAAALQGHLPILQWLIENGVTISKEEDATGLPHAACHNHFSVVKWIVEHDANPDEVGFNRCTALHWCAIKGNLEMVQYMMDYGANVKLRDDEGRTALHFAAQASQENIELVRFLLGSGIQVTDVDRWGRTALHYASVAQNFQFVEYLLKEFFLEKKEPPLADLQRTFIEAAKGNCVKRLLHLIERGVDIHCTTFQGRTALHEAAANGAMESINVLLEQGLNVNEADKFGVTPLLEACCYRRVDTIRRLLEAGGNVNDVDLAGQTALQRAAKAGQEETVGLLVESGADISSCDKRGWTPLHHAASGGHVGVVKSLAALDFSLENMKTNAGDTAAMLAVLRGHSDAAKMLGENNFGLEKYKEFQLDHVGIHFNSAAVESTGSWLGAPIEVKLKRNDSMSLSFAELLNRWSTLNHPHILNLYGFCHAEDGSKFPYFVCERTVCKRLSECFDVENPELMKDIWEKLYQIALGVQYLHNRDIVHGCINDNNVSLASNGVAKLQFFDGIRENITSTPEILAGLPPTFESDIYAFGLLIVNIISKSTQCYKSVDYFGDFNDAIRCGRLPSKPDSMTATQWNLIERMCCYNPSDRPSMADVIRELEAFAKSKLTSEEFSTCEIVSATDLPSWANVGEVRIGQVTVSRLLVEIDSLSGGSTEETTAIAKMQRDVYHRLVDILNQLQAQTGLPDVKVVEQYGKILRYFLMTLRTTRDEDSSLASSLAASRQGVDDTFCLHQDIDMFADSVGLSRSERIHQWQDLWQLRRNQQKHETLEKMGKLPSLLEEVGDEREREEELTYLRFELSKYPTSYASNNAADLTAAKLVLDRLSTSKNPDWFIPAHEVKFDRFDEFSRGSFGKVYHGQWNRSRVVVKKVELKSEEDRTTFLNEVGVWHKLFHPNVVRLYGACHTQQPFFVCELAGGGQLDHFLRAHPEELWQKLYEAALGLQYLHIKSIVHADLKCNNILIGSDGQAQLTDFGLSNIVSDVKESDTEPESERDSSGLVGAIRWKAPEVLQGGKSTFASDIYSFGMCIIEAVSGNFPWGTLPDIVVQYHVLEKKRIPVRPDNCSNAAYSLVERMCRFDPSKRVGMNAVVEELKAFHKSHC